MTTTTVMIGPPKNKEDDLTFVNNFMNQPGVKIVCGGTTAKIIARTLGCPETVDLTSLDEKIPPVGILPGIDLVTEGAITLTGTLETLKDKKQTLSGEGNGAQRLALLLQKSNNIHFMLGTGENTAMTNDNPWFYENKHQTITQIINLLSNMGKNVTCQYY